MTREEVLQALATYLRAEFGKLLVVREARRLRHATGQSWSVAVVIPSKDGDLAIDPVEIDEEGTIANPPDIDAILGAIRRDALARAAPQGVDAAGDVAELLGFGGDADEESPPSSVELDDEKLYARAQSLVSAGDAASLQKARVLLPRLLGDPARRSAVLVWMAVIERKLNQIPLALEYLEAAARDFADRFDISPLEKLATLALELMGKERYPSSTIAKLLIQARERAQPIGRIFECPQFFALSEDERDWLGDNLTLRTLAPGEDLVREGEPSRSVFVIKSGIVGVYLEKPEGGMRLVRCCFPGWLLGESSVLVDDDPRCTATLRAERSTEVWSIDGAVLRQTMAENEDLRHRIAATKQLHRIDSFFSMHETLSQLDAAVRDDMLGCIQRIQSFEVDTVLLPSGAVPAVACLIAKGEVAIYEGEPKGASLMVLPSDRFVGVRDALHAIAPSTSAVARAGSMIAFLSGELLRAVAERSPEQVVAVLERLG